MRTFVLRNGKSETFWHIDLLARGFAVVSGKVGTRGQVRTTTFDSAEQARAAHDKLVVQQVKKGYVETPRPPAPLPSADRLALEAALVAHPDEVAAHSAYADYLIEQGDPRGEFIQVQLALEDEKLPRTERTTLRKREGELQAWHEREWLGDLGRFLVGQWSGPDKPYHFQFHRGWLDYVRVMPYPSAVVAAVTRAPESRLLRRLEIVYDMRFHPFSFQEFTEGPSQVALANSSPHAARGPARQPTDGSLLPHFVNSLYLANLRALKLGFSDTDERPGHSTMVDPFGTCTTAQMTKLLKKCPRLDELYLNTALTDADKLFASPALGNFRVFQYYYGTAYSVWNNNPSDPYPLSVLARNKALANLTTLRFHPGREAAIELAEFDAILRSKNLPSLRHLQVHMTNFGDAGADRIVSSRILKRLKTLDIGYGSMTDAGAAVLAACPDLQNLEALNVSRNALTKAGVRALRKVHNHVVADEQHEPDDEGYLYEVDWE